MKNIPGPNRLALILALLLPAYFIIAALGTKVGMWDWKVGLLSLTFGAGPFLVGIVALVAIVTLIMALWKAPRKGWIASLIALIIPLGFVAMGASTAGTAAENPIHDVSTDIDNPPVFSATTMAARGEDSNPLNDYATPLGELDMWANSEEPLKSQSHADVITERYPELEPLIYSETNHRAVMAAAMEVMHAQGITDIMLSEDEAQAEGVAETFWFAFKDDVVIRAQDGQLDIRSVSRVGQSDLGANAARIADLRTAIAARIE